MIPVQEPRTPQKRAGGAEPLRRKRVLPKPAGSPTSLRRRGVQYLIVFATAVLLVDALIGDRGVLERMRARKEHQQLSASLEGLKRENGQLRRMMYSLRDDPSAIESLAREELGLIKPGEVLFIIREAKPASH